MTISRQVGLVRGGSWTSGPQDHADGGQKYRNPQAAAFLQLDASRRDAGRDVFTLPVACLISKRSQDTVLPQALR